MKKIIGKIISQLGYKISKRVPKDHDFFQTQVKLTDSTRRQIIFDVGAFDGETSKKYHKYFKSNCDIYSFEPFEDSFQLLQKNIASAKNIKPFQMAIGAKDETNDFYVNNFTATNSLLPASEEGLKTWDNDILVNKKIIKVPTMTIDSFLEKNKIEQVDILKLDTQGAEYLVLEGAEKSIRTGKIKMIISELIVMPSYENQKDLDEMLLLYKNYGFELYTFFNSIDANHRLKFIDGIFIYKN